MPQVHARSLAEVRRYDLFKLAVAVLLFTAWLFATDRFPVESTDPAPAAAAAPSVATSVATVDLAGGAGAGAAARATSSLLRIESTGNGVRLQGSVPDEAARDEYVAAARKALGRPDRVDDGLVVEAGAERPAWLPHVGPAMIALAGHDGVSATIDGEQVILEGVVADDRQRTDIADAVTAAFGAPFTVVNRLAIAEPGPAAAPSARVDPAGE